MKFLYFLSGGGGVSQAYAYQKGECGFNDLHDFYPLTVSFILGEKTDSNSCSYKFRRKKKVKLPWVREGIYLVI